MPQIKEVLNRVTGQRFEAHPNLIAYAKGDSATFELIYDDSPEKEEEVVYTEDNLKAMSMKDLQTIAEAYNLECDRRKKDSLIDAILMHGR